MIVDRLNAIPLVIQLPIGAESRLRRRRRPGRDAGAHLARRDRARARMYAIERHPGRPGRGRSRLARPACIETVAETDDELLELYLGGDEPTDGASSRPRSARHHRRQDQPGAVRLGVQEQGRAAHARRRRRLPAVAAGRAAIDGQRSTDEYAPSSARADADEPFSALAFKIMTRPAPRQADLRPGVLRHGRHRHRRSSTRTKDRKERIGKIFQMHANKREERPTRQRRPHRRGHRPEAHHHRRHPLRPAEAVILESMTFPAPVISVAIEPKTKATRRSSAPRSRSSPRRTRPSRSTGRGDRPDHHRRDGRAAPGGPGRPDAPRVQGRGQRRQAAGGLPRDHPPDGREGRLHPQEADRWFRPVRQGADRHRADWSDRRRPATSSSTRSPVAGSRGSTSRRSTRAPRRPCSTASWPATRWWASR